MSCFTGPYVVSHIFPCIVVEIQDLEIGAKFKVNAQRLKQFLKLPSTEDVECLILYELNSDE